MWLQIYPGAYGQYIQEMLDPNPVAAPADPPPARKQHIRNLPQYQTDATYYKWL